MESYPKFQNEVGALIVRIGCHEFERIGGKPPQDHPHVYLKPPRHTPTLPNPALPNPAFKAGKKLVEGKG
jgi:uncharacterized Zn-finger protein